MADVIGFPPPEPDAIPVRVLGVAWPRYGMGTIPDLSEEPRFDGRQHWIGPAAIVCRGRVKFTCVLPCMREPSTPEFRASAANDR